jgi:hypothetical protein
MVSMSEAWNKRRLPTVVDYIFSKIDKQENGCWIWKGAKIGRPSQFNYNNEVGLAPRKVYEKLIGPIPEGLCALHKCDDPRCVNPEHLYPGTKKQNRKDFMERHPKARQLLIEGAKRAGIGSKNRWARLSPAERELFIQRRAQIQAEKRKNEK